MIPAEYRQAHSEVDNAVHEIKALARALSQILIYTDALPGTHPDTASIHVLVDCVLERVRVAEAQQQREWAAIRSIFFAEVRA